MQRRISRHDLAGLLEVRPGQCLRDVLLTLYGGLVVVGSAVLAVEVDWKGGCTNPLVLLEHSITTLMGPGDAAVIFFISSLVIKRTISLISSKFTPLGPGAPGGPGRPSTPSLPWGPDAPGRASRPGRPSLPGGPTSGP